MRHTLHHLCWLLHRFRVVLIIYGCAWASLFAAVWLVLGTPHANAVSLGLHAVLPIIALLLLKDVLWQDAAPGTHEFWRTRPARWRAVWSSQTIFLCVFLAGPPLLCWALNGLLLDSSAQQWRFGMVDALLFLCPFIALAGILSFSRGWYSLALSFVAAAGCFIGGILVIAQNIGLTGFHFGTLDSDLRPRFAGYLGIGALVLALSWVAGMRRPGIRWRAIITGAALLVMPAVVQQIGMSPREAQPVALALVMNDTPRAELLRQGTNPEGLILQGVPDSAEAVIYDSDIRMSFIETTDFHGEVSSKAGEFPLWSGPPQRVFCYAAIPRKGLRALFPADCRWYSTAREEPRRPRQFDYLDANRLNVAEVKFRLIGTAQGLFVSAQRLVAVRLEVGSRAAENGSRVLLRRMEIESESLTLTAEVWRAGCMDEPIPPSGLAREQSFFTHRWLPVLYFPATGMAILAAETTGRSDFRSWQTVNRSLSLQVDLPAAEAIRGVRFTPEVVRGAQLVLCAPVVTKCFTATSPLGMQTLQAASTKQFANEEEEFASLLHQLKYLSWRNKASDPAIARLRSLGAPAVRAVLRHDWSESNGPLEDPGDFKDLWQGWLTDEFLPDLAAAMQHDPRWMLVAQMNGQAEKLAAPALEMVRRTHAPLPVSILTVAAGHAQPADYAMLRHHAALTIRAHRWPGKRGDDFDQLWQRLRALPDFPWRELAREQWQALHREALDHRAHQALLAAAVLAGDGTALNRLLESEPGDLHPEMNVLSSAEWTELAAMIIGIPAPGPERTAWLRQHRGYFAWDDVSGKYEVKR